MATFDGWEAQLYGPNTLAHFRTKGSKNGVRRFQMKDGTWTPLGLRLRKEREGWGESKAERKAEKKVRQAEKKAEKAERRVAAKEAAKEKLIRSKNRNEDLSSLSDEELSRKIQRAKMEAEFKEVTKSPALKTGERIVGMVLNHIENKSAREFEREKMALERYRLDVDKARTKANEAISQETTKQAKANSKRARMEARRARMDARKMKEDRKAGLATEREARRLNAEEAIKLLTWKGSHFRAKNLRIETRNLDKRAINKGTAFIRSVIESKKQAKKNNTAYIPELFEGQREYEKKLAEQRHQFRMTEEATKQAPYKAEIARQTAEAAKWAYEREKNKKK